MQVDFSSGKLGKDHANRPPTAKPCKSGVFERKPPKPWRLGPQTLRLILPWYSLPYTWSLLYSLVAILAAMRRFCFTIQVDGMASSQVSLL